MIETEAGKIVVFYDLNDGWLVASMDPHCFAFAANNKFPIVPIFSYTMIRSFIPHQVGRSGII